MTNNLYNFKKLLDLQTTLKNTTSLTEKKNIIQDYKKISDSAFNDKVFRYIFDNNIKFYITSKKVLENASRVLSSDVFYIEPTENNIFDVLDRLSTRKATGSRAIDLCLSMFNSLMNIDAKLAQLFFDILDKDFKCGVSHGIINSEFEPIKSKFGVTLANKYFDVEDKVNFSLDTWYASRKLDGCRCVCIKENGVVKFLSRQNKDFTTLGVLVDLMESVPDDNFVIDGEICIVDANSNEHYDQIMKLIKRKNYTIDRPFYQMFDFLSVDEFFGGKTSPVFSQRYSNLKSFFMSNYNILSHNCKVVEQTQVHSKSMFEDMFNEAQKKGWEGLMIRKDVPYENKRTNNLLKVKAFHDAEYEVIDYEIGPMTFAENGHQVTMDVLSSVTISHKGKNVHVGSGFSKEQRIYYKEHPEEILGHTIKVKYFEETNTASGSSLRFPTVLHVYGNDGRFD